ncbi:nucleoside-diphosphate kinase [Thiorhodococcus mannitoliphagus]|uniref:Nucleoside-diphosphate kinase n=1 Tax=Thiorhodococcus mannitoliphagus TaxID=329406 RepID=A0A6P1DWX2_9GAMM|nr:nucleoside-diphosphate kinase [Thiorhodococcus mannitoliphagus]
MICRGAIIVSPDGLALGAKPLIVSRLEKIGEIDETATIMLLPKDIQHLYRHQYRSGYRARLKERLFGLGPSQVLSLCVDSQSAWAHIRVSKGPSNPYRSVSGTIREQVDSIGTVFSALHAADTMNDAEIDHQYFFRESRQFSESQEEKEALSFPLCLSVVLGYLGADVTNIRRVDDTARGLSRALQLTQALDMVRSRANGVAEHQSDLFRALTNWREWSPHIAEIFPGIAVRANVRLDPWCQLVIESGISFFHSDLSDAQFE